MSELSPQYQTPPEPAALKLDKEHEWLFSTLAHCGWWTPSTHRAGHQLFNLELACNRDGTSYTTVQPYLRDVRGRPEAMVRAAEEEPVCLLVIITAAATALFAHLKKP